MTNYQNRDPSWVQWNVLFQRLGELSRTCGAANKNELAIVLISACIIDGVNTMPRIIGVLKRFGLTRQHIAITLNREAGPDHVRHHWYRHSNDTYLLHGDGSPLDLVQRKTLAESDT
jgi:hypothetical protein